GRHYDGTEVPLEMAVARLDLPTRTVYVGAFRDITQRRRTEARLQRLTTFQRAMLDSANNTIIATDTEGTIALVNPAVID
ncbi:PAS domain S-box protein, partial [Limnospira sp. PMC 1223.20]|uniref:PAS domain S-box protein n=1 Tax=Limnospira sp. PMC 1223.20 TaxID=2981021 RepID=UPI0028E0E6AC